MSDPLPGVIGYSVPQDEAVGMEGIENKVEGGNINGAFSVTS